MAVAVLGHHATILDWDILDGDDAVRGFFIISGFYMALVLNGKYADRFLRLFWTNRFLRLYPAYAVVLVLSLAALLVLGVHPFASLGRMLRLMDNDPLTISFVTWTNGMVMGQEWLFNLALAPDGGGLFWPAGPAGTRAFVCSLIPQAWSLSLEFQFYLAAPWLVRSGVRRMVPVFAAGLALRLGFALAGPEANRISHYLLPTELYLFMAGALAWRAYDALRATAWPRRLGPAALAALTAVILGYQWLPATWRFAAFALLLTASIPLVFGRFADNRLDRSLGELSYPFYLIHFLIIALAENYLPDLPGPALAAVVLLAAAALYLAVDRPVDRLRQRRLATALVLPTPIDQASAGMSPAVVPVTQHP